MAGLPIWCAASCDELLEINFLWSNSWENYSSRQENKAWRSITARKQDSSSQNTNEQILEEE